MNNILYLKFIMIMSERKGTDLKFSQLLFLSSEFTSFRILAKIHTSSSCASEDRAESAQATSCNGSGDLPRCFPLYNHRDTIRARFLLLFLVIWHVAHAARVGGSHCFTYRRIHHNCMQSWILYLWKNLACSSLTQRLLWSYIVLCRANIQRILVNKPHSVERGQPTEPTPLSDVFHTLPCPSFASKILMS